MSVPDLTYPDYLVEAANEVFSINANQAINLEKLSWMEKLVCRTLIRLSGDISFQNDIDLIVRLHQQHTSAFYTILGDPWRYTVQFLPDEEWVLLSGPVMIAPQVHQVFRSEAERLRNDLWQDHFSLQKFKNTRQRLNALVCYLSRALVHTAVIEKMDQQKSSLRMERLERAGHSILGAAIVGLNAAAFPSGPLSPAGVAVSGILGGTMLVANLEALS